MKSVRFLPFIPPSSYQVCNWTKVTLPYFIKWICTFQNVHVSVSVSLLQWFSVPFVLTSPHSVDITKTAFNFTYQAPWIGTVEKERVWIWIDQFLTMVRTAFSNVLNFPSLSTHEVIQFVCCVNMPYSQTLLYHSVGKARGKSLIAEFHPAASVSGSWCCSCYISVTLPWLKKMSHMNSTEPKVISRNWGFPTVTSQNLCCEAGPSEDA